MAKKDLDGKSVRSKQDMVMRGLSSSESHFIREKSSHSCHSRSMMEQEKTECAALCARLRTASAFASGDFHACTI
jgi:hypothetical protein